MTRDEALNQFCKMQGEIADRLGLDSICTCNNEKGKPKEGIVPDEIIEEMWRRLTHKYWAYDEINEGYDKYKGALDHDVAGWYPDNRKG